MSTRSAPSSSLQSFSCTQNKTTPPNITPVLNTAPVIANPISSLVPSPRVSAPRPPPPLVSAPRLPPLPWVPVPRSSPPGVRAPSPSLRVGCPCPFSLSPGDRALSPSPWVTVPPLPPPGCPCPVSLPPGVWALGTLNCSLLCAQSLGAAFPGPCALVLDGPGAWTGLLQALSRASLSGRLPFPLLPCLGARPFLPTPGAPQLLLDPWALRARANAMGCWPRSHKLPGKLLLA